MDNNTENSVFAPHEETSEMFDRTFNKKPTQTENPSHILENPNPVDEELHFWEVPKKHEFPPLQDEKIKLLEKDGELETLPLTQKERAFYKNYPDLMPEYLKGQPLTQVEVNRRITELESRPEDLSQDESMEYLSLLLLRKESPSADTLPKPTETKPNFLQDVEFTLKEENGTHHLLMDKLDEEGNIKKTITIEGNKTIDDWKRECDQFFKKYNQEKHKKPTGSFEFYSRVQSALNKLDKGQTQDGQGSTEPEAKPKSTFSIEPPQWSQWSLDNAVVNAKRGLAQAQQESDAAKVREWTNALNNYVEQQAHLNAWKALPAEQRKLFPEQIGENFDEEGLEDYIKNIFPDTSPINRDDIIINRGGGGELPSSHRLLRDQGNHIKASIRTRVVTDEKGNTLSVEKILKNIVSNETVFVEDNFVDNTRTYRDGSYNVIRIEKLHRETTLPPRRGNVEPIDDGPREYDNIHITVKPNGLVNIVSTKGEHGEPNSRESSESHYSLDAAQKNLENRIEELEKDLQQTGTDRTPLINSYKDQLAFLKKYEEEHSTRAEPTTAETAIPITPEKENRPPFLCEVLPPETIQGFNPHKLNPETGERGVNTHKNNEDVALIGNTFAVVADGMGGHAGGDKAAQISALAIYSAQSTLPENASEDETWEVFEDGWKQAQQGIEQYIDEEKTKGNDVDPKMGAALAAVRVIRENGKRKAVGAYSADVRILIIGKDGNVRKSSFDHGPIYELLMANNDKSKNDPERAAEIAEIFETARSIEDIPEEYRYDYWDNRNTVYDPIQGGAKYGWHGKDIKPTRFIEELEDDDMAILIQTDGRTDNVTRKQTEEIMALDLPLGEKIKMLTRQAFEISQLPTSENFRAKPDDITIAGIDLADKTKKDEPLFVPPLFVPPTFPPPLRRLLTPEQDFDTAEARANLGENIGETSAFEKFLTDTSPDAIEFWTKLKNLEPIYFVSPNGVSVVYDNEGEVLKPFGNKLQNPTVFKRSLETFLEKVRADSGSLDENEKKDRIQEINYILNTLDNHTQTGAHRFISYTKEGRIKVNKYVMKNGELETEIDGMFDSIDEAIVQLEGDLNSASPQQKLGIEQLLHDLRERKAHPDAKPKKVYEPDSQPHKQPEAQQPIKTINYDKFPKALIIPSPFYNRRIAEAYKNKNLTADKLEKIIDEETDKANSRKKSKISKSYEAQLRSAIINKGDEIDKDLIVSGEKLFKKFNDKFDENTTGNEEFKITPEAFAEYAKNMHFKHGKLDSQSMKTAIENGKIKLSGKIAGRHGLRAFDATLHVSPDGKISVEDHSIDMNVLIKPIFKGVLKKEAKEKAQLEEEVATIDQAIKKLFSEHLAKNWKLGGFRIDNSTIKITYVKEIPDKKNRTY